MTEIMGEKKEGTFYAPVERADMGVVLRQYKYFDDNHLLIQILESISMAMLILNKQRQLVFANKAFLNLVAEVDVTSILGFRAGEALGCLYSEVMEGGCGTSEHCRECGAVRAILNSFTSKQDVQECRITLKNNNQSLDLRVFASHLKHRDESFTVFSISDIAHEKRSQFLERLFLHDVKNTVGALQGFSRLLMDKKETELDISRKMIIDLSDKLLDEIDSYSQLIQAESKQLQVKPAGLSTREFLERIKNQYLNHPVASEKSIIVDSKSEDVIMISDETILGRVIGNMTKNALEAIRPGQVVTLSCVQHGDQVRMIVHNPGLIARTAQLQIFQRSFSTKGNGRGLGTFSIKMLSEQYLEGKVGFTTSAGEGTSFYGEYPISLDS
jgi:signal transduction histidine kinase